MIRKFVLAALLGLGTSGAATVWLPEQGQTGTLTAAGLRAADGRALSVLNAWNRPRPEALPLSGRRYMRVEIAPPAPPQLVVEDVRGNVQTSLGVTGLADAWPTVRGPCVTAQADPEPVTTCYDLTLQAVWATFDGKPVYVSRQGDVAYTTGAASRTQPYSPTVPITRVNLGTGETTALTLDAEAAEPDPAHRRDISVDSNANNTTWGWTPLPGNRFLACVSITMPKYGCRLDVIGQDARFLYTLQGNAYNIVPQRSQDGRLLYAVGNTLQVWNTSTGKRVRSIHDPLWDKQGRYAVNAFLIPDNREAAIVTGKYDQHGQAHELQLWRYRLDTGKRLSVTPLRGQ